MKSSQKSIERAERLYAEVRNAIPGVMLRNRSVTTSSIYCKTPDGFSLRIGDHSGKEKYAYKWNLGPQYGKRGWVREPNPVSGRESWRFYTSSVQELAEQIQQSIQWARDHGIQVPGGKS